MQLEPKDFAATRIGDAITAELTASNCGYGDKQALLEAIDDRIVEELEDLGEGEMDFPPWSGGVRSERHAAARMVIPSMLARASAGVR